MKIAVLGTGMVGQAIAGKVAQLGHETLMGTRDVSAAEARTDPHSMTGISFVDWKKDHPGVKLVSFGDMPADTDLFINATKGDHCFDALHMVGDDLLVGKTILDISNPLDFSKGMPPTLTVCNIDSMAERLQSEFSKSHLVKSLNTMTAGIMVNPSLIPGEHNVFVSGNDDGAKDLVKGLLREFGWTDRMIIDLGDISSARGAEMVLPLWLRIYGNLSSPEFNFQIVRK